MTIHQYKKTNVPKVCITCDKDFVGVTKSKFCCVSCKQKDYIIRKNRGKKND